MSDIIVSCIFELMLTTVLCVFIFWSLKLPDSNGGGKYRKALAIGDTAFTYCPIITGLVLAILIYISVGIYTVSGVSTGHMFPLITIPAMFPNGLGVFKVSIVKGICMLIAQFIAMLLAWAIVFGTNI